MRAFGVTLVTLALVLGAGGVARRPLADTSSGGPAADSAEIGTCKPSPPPRVVEIDTSNAPKDFVSLNTRGYNYRQPGDPPQVIPDSTGKQKPEAVVTP
jgi:hypothetical protein